MLVGVCVVFAGIGVRLFQLQASDRDELRSMGLGQRIRTVDVPAERGGIFDRSGADLALSIPQATITADPRVIDDPVGYAAKLAPIVGVDEADLATRLADRNSAFAYVARKVDDATAAKVKQLALPGISSVTESKRFYPAGALAGPLLGFTGTDNTGLAGLESAFESTLAGRAGEARVEQDPEGHDIPGGARQGSPAKPGADLVLTIDRYLQWKTEQVLTSEVTKADAVGGTAILADVQTGDILAMANVVGPTDGAPAQSAPASTPNRAVTDVYEPGSTNKVITMAAAVEEGLVTPDTVLTDVGPSIPVGDTVFEDAEDHPTAMTVAQILQHSSNVGTIRIAAQLGAERLDHYLRAFGFGTRTALNFPGEADGILLPLDQYNDTSMGAIPVGYGLAVTAMQMLDVYMTIANGGMARPPRLVEATIDADGRRVDEPTPATHAVVSPAAARAVTGMLEQVVSGGTGTKASVNGYQVAGKTGTARKPPYDKPPYKYVASFAGFAPAASPRIAAIVVIDEPADLYYGGDVAAPAFSQILQEALRVMQVPPSS